MIVGTAGHIDHGKTSVVYALTGVDTDRLKEEKARGISIELGYAYTALGEDEILGYVDVPGHEKFVHTMAAGVAGIDFALLVVAADDGVMPQTREHVAILELLGVRHGAVALTKVDSVQDARVREVSAQIIALTGRASLRAAPIFPVNAIACNDPGIAALRSYIHDIALAWPARSTLGLFRLSVDRVFSLPGRGTVAAGTVHAGTVRVGETVTLMPLGATARIRSIHAQSRDTDIGVAGQRCALSLVGIEKTQLRRGDWLADPRALSPSTRMDVKLDWLAPMNITERSAFHVHLGTAHRVARFSRLFELPHSPQNVRMQLGFEVPVCAAVGDRFIVRDAQARHTLGGGVVIDANAPARHRRSQARSAYLDAVESLLAGDGLHALLHTAQYGVAMEELARLCGREPHQIELPAGTRVVATANGSVAILKQAWSSLVEGALRELEEFHRDSPGEPGIDRGRWRRLSSPAASDDLWRALVDELLRKEAIVRNGPWLQLPQHRVEFPEASKALVEKLHGAIAAAHFDPPWVRDLSKTLAVPEDEVRLTLQRSTRMGGVHQVVPDLFYHRDSIRKLALMLEEIESVHGIVGAAQFRDAVGLGRKRSIQILEFFDRVGYTRRIRDGRKLRTDSDWRQA